MEGSITLMLLLQLILILLNAVFACAEIAVISMNENKTAKLAADGNKKAVRLQRLKTQPAKFLATIQVAITLSGFLGSAFAADNFSDRLVSLLMKTGIPVAQKTLDTVSVIFITLILSYFTLVFGELVPKRLAMRKTEALALGMSGSITVISKIFAPIVWLLTKSTNGVLRLFGIDPNADDEKISEEDIRLMVDAGSENGAIAHEEKEFIQNVFEFDDINAGEIATHRTEISLLWMEESMDDWEKTIHNSRHTMYPVCKDSVDDIVGILNAKDYFRLSDKSRENVMKQAVKPAYFVPESVKADILLRNMKSSRNTLAVVLDEYGGLTGIVTLSDLVQRLVGDIEEETGSSEKEPEIEQLDSGTWKIPGSAELNDVCAALGKEIICEDCDTFNGYVLGLLGTVPEDGSKTELEADGMKILITDIADHKIKSATVCLTSPRSEPSSESGRNL